MTKASILNWKSFGTLVLITITFLLYQNQTIPLEQCVASHLWDVNSGKKSGRIVDFAKTGFPNGPEFSPVIYTKVDIRNYGANGTDSIDDTLAFQNAIKHAQISGPTIIEIPSGQYFISDVLTIQNLSHVYIVGVGETKPTLYFTKPIDEIYPEEQLKGNNDRNLTSFGMGLIVFQGIPQSKTSIQSTLAIVRGDKPRGAISLKVNPEHTLQIGQWIRLIQQETNQEGATKIIHSLLGNDSNFIQNLTELQIEKYSKIKRTPKNNEPIIEGFQFVQFIGKIVKISKNRETVYFDREIPVEVKTDWNPKLMSYNPTLDVGIKNLKIEFPHTMYPGHFKEHGYNALHFSDVSRCVAEDIEITNADYGIFMDNTQFCTLKDIVINTSQERANDKNFSGHHAITVSSGLYNVVRDFDIQTRFVHDLTVTTRSLVNVYSRGKGVDLNMDHHRDYPYANLFTEINIGDGTRPFHSSGYHDGGPHAGAYNTFWNISSKTNIIPIPPSDFGPHLNFIAVGHLRHRKVLGWYVKSIRKENTLCAPNLFHSMRSRRP